MLVPGGPDIEFRVSRFIRPFIKKPVEVVPGRLFDRDLEVVRFDRFVRELVNVMVDRLPIEIVSKDIPQHMQDARPLAVNTVVKQLVRADKVGVHRRLSFFSDIGVDDIALGIIDAFQRDIPPFVVFLEQDVEVRGEPFVEPRVRPVFCREQIPPPLVRELVGDQAVARIIEMRARVVNRNVG